MSTSSGFRVAGAAVLVAFFTGGCSRAEPEPPPVLSAWAEQVAAAERVVRDRGGDFVLTDAGAYPTREPGQPAAPGEPMELKVYFYFVRPEPTQRPDEQQPAHEMFSVRFNDHRLATTLKVEGLRRVREDEKIPGGLGAMRFGPQDVLKATQAEGETYMGEPVNAGNFNLALSRPSWTPPDLRGRALWRVVYHRTQDDRLVVFVDAQTGEVVKRETGTKKEQAGASPSPSPKP